MFTNSMYCFQRNRHTFSFYLLQRLNESFADVFAVSIRTRYKLSRHRVSDGKCTTFIFSPYAQMPGYGGYQTGRPTVQQQHWDQYGGYPRGAREPRDPRDYDPYARDPYRRDYW